jgi:UDP-N-acetylmuramoylalanine--D-glutamate ligase
VLGRHRIDDFAGADFVLKNPAVPDSSPFLAAARRRGVPVLTDIGLFFLGLPAGVRVVGVTGTKGKTTTSRMIYEILRTKFPAAIVGVPGTSFLGLLDSLKPGTIVVAEISSFDLEGLRMVGRSPDIAVLTNIAPDHLDRYRTMAAYRDAKSLIFRFQGRRGTLVANRDDAVVRTIAAAAPGRTVWFSGARYHTEANANAARAVARLFGIPRSTTERALASFGQLPGHLEHVAERGNAAMVNDTCATNPFATKMALRAIRAQYPDRDIVVILGGADKRLRFNALLPEIRSVRGAIVLHGSASPKIIAVLARAGVAPVMKARTLHEALRQGLRCVRRTGRKGVILFSPAAASFNMFKNEFDRGEKFTRAVMRLR